MIALRDFGRFSTALLYPFLYVTERIMDGHLTAETLETIKGKK